MKLNTLISSLGKYSPGKHATLSPAYNFEVKGISCDSRKVSSGYLFVAVKGTRLNGGAFIKEAIARGAKCVVAEDYKLGKSVKREIVLIKVSDARRALARLAAAFYGNPSHRIKVVGITGTNGKTTVSYLIEALLKEARSACAVIGTVNYRFRDKIVPSVNTTPGPIELNSLLSLIHKEGIPYVAMEVSSHALAQRRIEAIDFYCAIFTNLTQDHLDYHGTLENYFQAKLRLFKNIIPGGCAIINNDDKYAARIKRATRAEVITYGITQAADVVAKRIRFGLKQTSFCLSGRYGTAELKSRLIGRHNIYNILAACSWALSEGLGLATVKAAVAKFVPAPGRLERIESQRGFYVFVDYAHTEDALKNAILSFREITKGRIIVVFGCGGERDKQKRPKMGSVVSRLADFAVITSDNPRSEDPEEIIRDIKRGIKKQNFCVVPQRRQAIRKALSLAQKGDTVLIAGKGHENCQVLKDKKIHFDDREVVGECLK